jgi:hypothetical protein
LKPSVDVSDFCRYIKEMETTPARRGRPPKQANQRKAEYLDIRLNPDEKQAFRDAADLSGLDLSAWVRERLRGCSRKELDAAGRRVAFMNKGGEHG